MQSLLFKNARILGRETADILVIDQQIAAVGHLNQKDYPEAEHYDASGLVALPGLVDLHTHLRQPGEEDSETVETGSQAAALGGYTCVHAMANTTPSADSAEIVEQVYLLGRQSGWVEVRPVGAVTKGLAGSELSDLEEMAESKAKVRVFSDDGKCVFDALLMRQALQRLKPFGALIAQHAQEPRLTIDAQMNESDLSRELELTGWPTVAEEAIIARDVLLSQYLDVPVHICHLSTANAVEIVRLAKSKGIKVSAEATPHHLLLTEQCATSLDPVYKVNPPLRTQADVQALRAGLADGTIDIVGTDHAPHSAEKKSCGWQAGAFGMIGLETALPVVHTVMVKNGPMDFADLARVLSIRPAQLGQVANQGQSLAAGSPANICFFDPDYRFEVSKLAQHSKSSNTPFVGQTLYGQVVYTCFEGTLTVKSAQLNRPHRY